MSICCFIYTSQVRCKHCNHRRRITVPGGGHTLGTGGAGVEAIAGAVGGHADGEIFAIVGGNAQRIDGGATGGKGAFISVGNRHITKIKARHGLVEGKGGGQVGGTVDLIRNPRDVHRGGAVIPDSGHALVTGRPGVGAIGRRVRGHGHHHIRTTGGDHNQGVAGATATEPVVFLGAPSDGDIVGGKAGHGFAKGQGGGELTGGIDLRRDPRDVHRRRITVPGGGHTLGTGGAGVEAIAGAVGGHADGEIFAIVGGNAQRIDGGATGGKGAFISVGNRHITKIKARHGLVEGKGGGQVGGTVDLIRNPRDVHRGGAVIPDSGHALVTGRPGVGAIGRRVRGHGHHHIRTTGGDHNQGVAGATATEPVVFLGAPSDGDIVGGKAGHGFAKGQGGGELTGGIDLRRDPRDVHRRRITVPGGGHTLGTGGAGVEAIAGAVGGHADGEIFAIVGGNAQRIDGGATGGKGAFISVGNRHITKIKARHGLVEGKGGGQVGGTVDLIRNPRDVHRGGAVIPDSGHALVTGRPGVGAIGRRVRGHGHHHIRTTGGDHNQGVAGATATEPVVFLGAPSDGDIVGGKAGHGFAKGQGGGELTGGIDLRRDPRDVHRRRITVPGGGHTLGTGGAGVEAIAGAVGGHADGEIFAIVGGNAQRIDGGATGGKGAFISVGNRHITKIKARHGLVEGKGGGQVGGTVDLIRNPRDVHRGGAVIPDSGHALVTGRPGVGAIGRRVRGHGHHHIRTTGGDHNQGVAGATATEPVVFLGAPSDGDIVGGKAGHGFAKGQGGGELTGGIDLRRDPRDVHRRRITVPGGGHTLGTGGAGVEAIAGAVGGHADGEIFAIVGGNAQRIDGGATGGKGAFISVGNRHITKIKARHGLVEGKGGGQVGGTVDLIRNPRDVHRGGAVIPDSGHALVTGRPGVGAIGRRVRGHGHHHIRTTGGDHNQGVAGATATEPVVFLGAPSDGDIVGGKAGHGFAKGQGGGELTGGIDLRRDPRDVHRRRITVPGGGHTLGTGGAGVEAIAGAVGGHADGEIFAIVGGNAQRIDGGATGGKGAFISVGNRHITKIKARHGLVEGKGGGQVGGTVDLIRNPRDVHRGGAVIPDSGHALVTGRPGVGAIGRRVRGHGHHHIRTTGGDHNQGVAGATATEPVVFLGAPSDGDIVGGKAGHGFAKGQGGGELTGGIDLRRDPRDVHRRRITVPGGGHTLGTGGAGVEAIAGAVGGHADGEIFAIVGGNAQRIDGGATGGKGAFISVGNRHITKIKARHGLVEGKGGGQVGGTVDLIRNPRDVHRGGAVIPDSGHALVTGRPGVGAIGRRVRGHGHHHIRTTGGDHNQGVAGATATEPVVFLGAPSDGDIVGGKAGHGFAKGQGGGELTGGIDLRRDPRDVHRRRITVPGGGHTLGTGGAGVEAIAGAVGGHADGEIFAIVGGNAQRIDGGATGGKGAFISVGNRHITKIKARHGLVEGKGGGQVGGTVDLIRNPRDVHRGGAVIPDSGHALVTGRPGVGAIGRRVRGHGHHHIRTTGGDHNQGVAGATATEPVVFLGAPSDGDIVGGKAGHGFAKGQGGGELTGGIDLRRDPRDVHRRRITVPGGGHTLGTGGAGVEAIAGAVGGHADGEIFAIVGGNAQRIDGGATGGKGAFISVGNRHITKIKARHGLVEGKGGGQVGGTVDLIRNPRDVHRGGAVIPDSGHALVTGRPGVGAIGRRVRGHGHHHIRTTGGDHNQGVAGATATEPVVFLGAPSDGDIVGGKAGHGFAKGQGGGELTGGIDLRRDPRDVHRRRITVPGGGHTLGTGGAGVEAIAGAVGGHADGEIFAIVGGNAQRIDGGATGGKGAFISVGNRHITKIKARHGLVEGKGGGQVGGTVDLIRNPRDVHRGGAVIPDSGHALVTGRPGVGAIGRRVRGHGHHHIRTTGGDHNQGVAGATATEPVVFLGAPSDGDIVGGKAGHGFAKGQGGGELTGGIDLRRDPRDVHRRRITVPGGGHTLGTGGAGVEAIAGAVGGHADGEIFAIVGGNAQRIDGGATGGKGAFISVGNRHITKIKARHGLVEGKGGGQVGGTVDLIRNPRDVHRGGAVIPDSGHALVTGRPGVGAIGRRVRGHGHHHIRTTGGDHNQGVAGATATEPVVFLGAPSDGDIVGGKAGHGFAKGQGGGELTGGIDLRRDPRDVHRRRITVPGGGHTLGTGGAGVEAIAGAVGGHADGEIFAIVGGNAQRIDGGATGGKGAFISVGNRHITKIKARHGLVEGKGGGQVGGTVDLIRNPRDVHRGGAVIPDSGHALVTGRPGVGAIGRRVRGHGHHHIRTTGGDHNQGVAGATATEPVVFLGAPSDGDIVGGKAGHGFAKGQGGGELTGGIDLRRDPRDVHRRRITVPGGGHTLGTGGAGVEAIAGAVGGHADGEIFAIVGGNAQRIDGGATGGKGAFISVGNRHITKIKARHGLVEGKGGGQVGGTVDLIRNPRDVHRGGAVIPDSGHALVTGRPGVGAIGRRVRGHGHHHIRTTGGDHNQGVAGATATEPVVFLGAPSDGDIVGGKAGHGFAKGQGGGELTGGIDLRRDPRDVHRRRITVPGGGHTLGTGGAGVEAIAGAVGGHADGEIFAIVGGNAQRIDGGATGGKGAFISVGNRHITKIKARHGLVEGKGGGQVGGTVDLIRNPRDVHRGGAVIPDSGHALVTGRPGVGAIGRRVRGHGHHHIRTTGGDHNQGVAGATATEPVVFLGAPSDGDIVGGKAGHGFAKGQGGGELTGGIDLRRDPRDVHRRRITVPGGGHTLGTGGAGVEAIAGAVGGHADGEIFAIVGGNAQRIDGGATGGKGAFISVGNRHITKIKARHGLVEGKGGGQVGGTVDLIRNPRDVHRGGAVIPDSGHALVTGRPGVGAIGRRVRGHGHHHIRTTGGDHNQGVAGATATEPVVFLGAPSDGDIVGGKAGHGFAKGQGGGELTGGIDLRRDPRDVHRRRITVPGGGHTLGTGGAGVEAIAGAVGGHADGEIFAIVGGNAQRIDGGATGGKGAFISVGNRHITKIKARHGLVEGKGGGQVGGTVDLIRNPRDVHRGGAVIPDSGHALVTGRPGVGAIGRRVRGHGHHHIRTTGGDHNQGVAGATATEPVVFLGAPSDGDIVGGKAGHGFAKGQGGGELTGGIDLRRDPRDVHRRRITVPGGGHTLGTGGAGVEAIAGAVGGHADGEIFAIVGGNAQRIDGGATGGKGAFISVGNRHITKIKARHGLVEGKGGGQVGGTVDLIRNPRDVHRGGAVIPDSGHALVTGRPGVGAIGRRVRGHGHHHIRTTGGDHNQGVAGATATEPVVFLGAPSDGDIVGGKAGHGFAKGQGGGELTGGIDLRRDPRDVHRRRITVPGGGHTLGTGGAGVEAIAGAVGGHADGEIFAIVGGNAQRIDGGATGGKGAFISVGNRHITKIKARHGLVEGKGGGQVGGTVDLIRNPRDVHRGGAVIPDSGHALVTGRPGVGAIGRRVRGHGHHHIRTTGGDHNQGVAGATATEPVVFLGAPSDGDIVGGKAGHGFAKGQGGGELTGGIDLRRDPRDVHRRRITVPGGGHTLGTGGAGVEAIAGAVGGHADGEIFAIVGGNAQRIDGGATGGKGAFISVGNRHITKIKARHGLVEGKGGGQVGGTVDLRRNPRDVHRGGAVIPDSGHALVTGRPGVETIGGAVGIDTDSQIFAIVGGNDQGVFGRTRRRKRPLVPVGDRHIINIKVRHILAEGKSRGNFICFVDLVRHINGKRGGSRIPFGRRTHISLRPLIDAIGRGIFWHRHYNVFFAIRYDDHTILRSISEP